MLPIGVVSRRTGIESSTLRKWEARYGFPMPRRDTGQQRFYRDADVLLLNQIARRVAAGERVGRVIRELQAAHGLTGPGSAEPAAIPGDPLKIALEALGVGSQAHLRSGFERVLEGASLLRFVEDFATPLSRTVGHLWATGRLPVYREHLYASALERFLIEHMRPCAGEPEILLVNPSGERHSLGLTMVQAVLSEAGIECVRLHSDLPPEQIAAACLEMNLHTVALSASQFASPRFLWAELSDLRRRLPSEIALWAGGAGVDRMGRLPVGVASFPGLQALISAAQARRAAQLAQ